MAREIKRLADRSDRLLPVDQLRRRDPEAWEKALKWWGDLGINKSLLRTLLGRVGVARSQFEERLEEQAAPLAPWKIRRARSALKGAGPLIRLLKTEWALDGPPELFFDDLGEQVERAVQNYIDALRPAPTAKGRPGEPWLRKETLLLARLLLARKQSMKGTVRAIHGLFELAGHGDVATAEKIRHYLREERRRDPKFGVRLPAAFGAWFAKESAWSPTPGELGGRRRSRPPRRQVKDRRRALRKKTKRGGGQRAPSAGPEGAPRRAARSATAPPASVRATAIMASPRRAMAQSSACGESSAPATFSRKLASIRRTTLGSSATRCARGYGARL